MVNLTGKRKKATPDYGRSQLAKIQD